LLVEGTTDTPQNMIGARLEIILWHRTTYDTSRPPHPTPPHVDLY